MLSQFEVVGERGQLCNNWRIIHQMISLLTLIFPILQAPRLIRFQEQKRQIPKDKVSFPNHQVWTKMVLCGKAFGWKVLLGKKVVRHVHGWYDGRAGCIIEPLGDNWCSENFCGGKKRLKRTKREIHWNNKKKGVYPILLVHLNEGTVFCQVVASTTATGRHLLSQFLGHFHSYFFY